MIINKEIGAILTKEECLILGKFNRKYIRKRVKFDGESPNEFREAIRILERFTDILREEERIDD